MATLIILLTSIPSNMILYIILFAAISAIVGVERGLRLRDARRQNRAFVGEVAPLLIEWELASISPLAKRYPHSQVARLFSRMTTRYLGAMTTGWGINPVQLAEGEAQLGVQEGSEELGRRLPVLLSMAGLAVATGVAGALLTTSTTESLLAIGSALLVAGGSFGAYWALKNQALKVEAALHFSAEEFLHEMACNYDHDAMEEVLRTAA